MRQRLRPALLLPLLLVGCGSSQDPARMTRGDELYQYYCSGCHQQQQLGANLEHLPGGIQLKPLDIVLMLRHGYDTRHPKLQLTQLSPAQADAIARHVARLQAQNN